MQSPWSTCSRNAVLALHSGVEATHKYVQRNTRRWHAAPVPAPARMETNWSKGASTAASCWVFSFVRSTASCCCAWATHAAGSGSCGAGNVAGSCAMGTFSGGCSLLWCPVAADVAACCAVLAPLAVGARLAGVACFVDAHARDACCAARSAAALLACLLGDLVKPQLVSRPCLLSGSAFLRGMWVAYGSQSCAQSA